MKPFFGKDLGESMFADNAKIFIKSGKGGDGHVSFRKELFVPAGGPDGGDGGKGGDIIFEVDPGLNTLTDFRHVRKYVARDGEQGGKKRCHGANAENLVIKVPEGTVIKDFETGKVIADMSGENKRRTILRGGKGGLGNMNFATPTMQAPKVCTARSAGPRALGSAGAEGHCRRWTGWFPKRRKVHPSFPRVQRKTENCKLSFYDLKPASGCG